MLPNEAAVLPILKEVKQDGLYFYPGGGWRSDMSAAEKQQAMEKSAALMASGTPGGLLLVHPAGMVGMTAGQLGTQFGADVVSMLLAAFVIAQMGSATFGARFVVAILLALLPALRSHIPLWNWYGFPAVYTSAQITIDVVGFAIGGAIVARMAQKRPGLAAAAA